MAKATNVSKVVRQPKRQKGIQLTLTEGEADFLIAILAYIGGDAKDSPRKYAERIYDALKRATGLGYSDTDAFPLSHGGGVEFEDYPNPDGGHNPGGVTFRFATGGVVSREQAAEAGRHIADTLRRYRDSRVNDDVSVLL